MGGLTVARMSGEAEAQVASVRPKGKWPLLLAVPEQSLSTEEARRVLPSEYSRADAVTNVQNSMLLLAAFMQGRPDFLAAALEDRIHQPYRAALCPLLPCLQELKGKDGVLGAALSGAGPSVLMFLDPRAHLQKARKLVADPSLAKSACRRSDFYVDHAPWRANVALGILSLQARPYLECAIHHARYIEYGEPFLPCETNFCRLCF